VSSIELVGVGSLGATLGLLVGIFISRRMGLTPSARELKQALEANESYYKQMVSRFRGRLKEYEQPSELQRFAQNTQGVAPDNMIEMLASELPNIRGLPRWLRPMIPGIQAYLKENPDQVTELVNKFMSKTRAPEESIDYL